MGFFASQLNPIMSKKIYHLSTCNTCQKILKTLEPLNDMELQDIKTDPITPTQLEEMYALSQSYESLFSRRAMLFRQRGLNNQELGEADYKNLILEHYTFLKRPVVVWNDKIFIGNSKKTVEAAKEAIHS